MDDSHSTPAKHAACHTDLPAHLPEIDVPSLTEEDARLELVGLLEEYARGWLGACGTMLTKREWELLPYAPLIITSEDGIRFLMDYIQGDKYYYTSYKGQNLDRARTQLHLLKDMETKLPKIKEIISNIATNLK